MLWYLKCCVLHLLMYTIKGSDLKHTDCVTVYRHIGGLNCNTVNKTNSVLQAADSQMKTKPDAPCLCLLKLLWKPLCCRKRFLTEETLTVAEWATSPRQHLTGGVILFFSRQVRQIIQPCHPLCGRCSLGNLKACPGATAVPKYTGTVSETSVQVDSGMDGELCTSMAPDVNTDQMNWAFWPTVPGSEPRAVVRKHCKWQDRGEG